MKYGKELTKDFENFSTVALYVETKSVSETLLTFICLKTLFSCFAPNKPQTERTNRVQGNLRYFIVVPYTALLVELLQTRLGIISLCFTPMSLKNGKQMKKYTKPWSFSSARFIYYVQTLTVLFFYNISNIADTR